MNETRIVEVETLKRTAGTYNSKEPETMTIDSYELTIKRFGIPTGAVVVDDESFITSFKTAVEYAIYTDWRNLYRSLTDKLVKEEEKTDRADFNRIHWLNECKASLYEAIGSLTYVNESTFTGNTSFDSLYLWLAFAATGAKCFELEAETRLMFKRFESLDYNQNNMKQVKGELNDWLNSFIDFKAVEAVKNRVIKLNDAQAGNIFMLIKTESRKWNERGIESRKMKPYAVFQQVLLTVFGDVLKLEIVKSTAAAGRTYIAKA